jgi:hypothetical protein
MLEETDSTETSVTMCHLARILSDSFSGLCLFHLLTLTSFKTFYSCVLALVIASVV